MPKELSGARETIAVTAMQLRSKETEMSKMSSDLQDWKRRAETAESDLASAHKRLANALDEARGAAELRVRVDKLKKDDDAFNQLRSFYNENVVKKCMRCGVEFTNKTNSDTSCASHPGNFVTDQLYSSSSSIGTWSCCGKHSHNAPPCTFHGKHVSET